MGDIIRNNQTVALVTLVIISAIIVIISIRIMQVIGLEKIRKVVYDGFLIAEYKFQHGDNTQKFEYVVNLAKSTVPAPFNLFITESLLRKVIQTWFNLCKDLLDDGKLNNTRKENE